MEDKYTLEEFGQLIKDKYPEYADIDNVTLAQKMLEKYPEYSEQVTMDVVEEPVKKKKRRLNQWSSHWNLLRSRLLRFLPQVRLLRRSYRVEIRFLQSLNQ